MCGCNSLPGKCCCTSGGSSSLCECKTIIADGNIDTFIRLDTNKITLDASGPSIVVDDNVTDKITFVNSGTKTFSITGAGNIIAGGQVALSTTATNGFLYIPSCAGLPTGTPATITGMVPIVFDTANDNLYAYNGGSWHHVN